MRRVQISIFQGYFWQCLAPIFPIMKSKCAFWIKAKSQAQLGLKNCNSFFSSHLRLTRATERVNEKPVWQLAQPWDWRASWQSHLLKIASLYIGLLGFFCSRESWALFRPTLPMGSITGLMARKGMFDSAWRVIGVLHVCICKI